MNLDEVMRRLQTFRASAWRLETRQVYDVPQETEQLTAFLAGKPLPPPPPPKVVVAAVAAGKRIGRVHLVDLPLSDYLRWELSVYPQSVAAGEDIRIADRAAHPDLADLREDFILLDAGTGNAQVIWIRYADDGQVLGYEHSDDDAALARCIAAQRLALMHAVPLAEFVAAVGIE